MSAIHKNKTFLTPTRRPVEPSPVKPVSEPSDQQRLATNEALKGILDRLEALEKWRAANFGS